MMQYGLGYPPSNNFNNQGYNMGTYPPGYVSPTIAYHFDQQQVPNAYQSQYSPFMNQQQFQPYTPGMVSPIQVENSNGEVRQIPTQQTPYMQGGTVVNQGGYNPTTGVINQSNAYNPYANMTPIPPVVNNNGYNLLRTGPGQNPYMSPQYGYAQGYSYNQFDATMQDLLYNENPSDTSFDVEEMLSGIILSDKEREKINHNKQVSYIVGHDYYGNPIYSNNNQTAYQINQNRQNQIQEERERYQDHFVRLAKVAAAYNGEKVNEARVREIFDPLPQQKAAQPAKVFNYYSATEEEKLEYNREMRFEQTLMIAQRFDAMDQCKQKAEQIKADCYAKIKESHDKLIGVKPGEHYSLSQFLTEGYKLGLNIQQQEIKRMNRNGQNKYRRNEYREGLAQTTNSAIPITSKDDSYVTIEQCIKSMYEKNKANNNITSVLITMGDNNYQQTNLSNEENKHHLEFLEKMQEKKVIDDARRGV